LEGIGGHFNLKYLYRLNFTNQNLQHYRGLAFLSRGNMRGSTEEKTLLSWHVFLIKHSLENADNPLAELLRLDSEQDGFVVSNALLESKIDLNVLFLSKELRDNKTTFLFLTRSLDIAVHLKKSTLVDTLLVLLNSCLNSMNVAMMFEKIETGRVMGATPCFFLMGALSFAIAENSESVSSIVAMINTIFVKHDARHLTGMMSKKIESAPLAAITPCYLLIRALSLAVNRKNIVNMSAVAAIANTMLSKCDTAQIVATMLVEVSATGFLDWWFNARSPLALLAEIASKTEHPDPDIRNLLFNLLCKLGQTQGSRDDIPSVGIVKKSLKAFLKRFLEEKKDDPEFAAMCDPSTLLGVLIDAHTGLYLPAGVTGTRSLVNQYLAAQKERKKSGVSDERVVMTEEDRMLLPPTHGRAMTASTYSTPEYFLLDEEENVLPKEGPSAAERYEATTQKPTITADRTRESVITATIRLVDVLESEVIHDELRPVLNALRKTSEAYHYLENDNLAGLVQKAIGIAEKELLKVTTARVLVKPVEINPPRYEEVMAAKKKWQAAQDRAMKTAMDDTTGESINMSAFFYGSPATTLQDPLCAVTVPQAPVLNQDQRSKERGPTHQERLVLEL